MQFGHYLKQKRTELGWTQPDAAAKIGIEQSYLSKLETGKSAPSDEIFNKIKDVYSIDVSNLVETVVPDDLVKLNDVTSIKSSIHAFEGKRVTAKRRWLLMGLLFAILGSALISTYFVPSTTKMEVLYRSMGVIKVGEDLDTFKDFNTGIFDSNTRNELAERLDPIEKTFNSSRGSSFIEQVDGGVRIYRNITWRNVDVTKFPRWLIIPGFALFIGGIACFLIASMWHKRLN